MEEWAVLDGIYQKKYDVQEGSPYWYVQPSKVLAWDGGGLQTMTRWIFAKEWLKRSLVCEQRMAMNPTKPKNIDEYIARFPENVQELLEKVRATIKVAAPDAKEMISYQMPAFHQQGNLVYFAAWKKHIGFYPPVSEDAEFKQAVAVYEGPKGNLIFPLDQPIPYELISKIVKLRVKENLARAVAKRTNRYDKR